MNMILTNESMSLPMIKITICHVYQIVSLTMSSPLMHTPTLNILMMMTQMTAMMTLGTTQTMMMTMLRLCYYHHAH